MHPLRSRALLGPPCGLLLASLAVASGCGGRELGWLVPRLSVSAVVRSSSTGLSAEGWLGLSAPLSGPELPRSVETESAPATTSMLAAGPPCRLAPLCRWESRASAAALAALARESQP